MLPDCEDLSLQSLGRFMTEKQLDLRHSFKSEDCSISRTCKNSRRIGFKVQDMMSGMEWNGRCKFKQSCGHGRANLDKFVSLDVQSYKTCKFCKLTENKNLQFSTQSTVTLIRISCLYSLSAKASSV